MALKCTFSGEKTYLCQSIRIDFVVLGIYNFGFNHGLFNSKFMEKILMVEKWFIVEGYWVEVWGWKFRGWNDLQSIQSRAFDGYELLDTELDTQIRKLHTLDATSTRTQNEGRSNQFGIYKSNEFYFLDNV